MSMEYKKFQYRIFLMLEADANVLQTLASYVKSQAREHLDLADVMSKVGVSVDNINCDGMILHCFFNSKQMKIEYCINFVDNNARNAFYKLWDNIFEKLGFVDIKYCAMLVDGENVMSYIFDPHNIKFFDCTYMVDTDPDPFAFDDETCDLIIDLPYWYNDLELTKALQKILHTDNVNLQELIEQMRSLMAKSSASYFEINKIKRLNVA